jgi:hypothetical protein
MYMADKRSKTHDKIGDKWRKKCAARSHERDPVTLRCKLTRAEKGRRCTVKAGYEWDGEKCRKRCAVGTHVRENGRCVLSRREKAVRCYNKGNGAHSMMEHPVTKKWDCRKNCDNFKLRFDGYRCRKTPDAWRATATKPTAQMTDGDLLGLRDLLLLQPRRGAPRFFYTTGERKFVIDQFKRALHHLYDTVARRREKLRDLKIGGHSFLTVNEESYVLNQRAYPESDDDHDLGGPPDDPSPDDPSPDDPSPDDPSPDKPSPDDPSPDKPSPDKQPSSAESSSSEASGEGYSPDGNESPAERSDRRTRKKKLVRKKRTVTPSVKKPSKRRRPPAGRTMRKSRKEVRRPQTKDTSSSSSETSVPSEPQNYACNECRDAPAVDLPHIKKDASVLWKKILKFGEQDLGSFLQDETPLSEFLSICNLGTIAPEKEFLSPQQVDTCSKFKKDNCPEEEGCVVFKGDCVKQFRVRKFAETSDVLGNRIEGRHTKEALGPFSFSLIASHPLVKFLLRTKTKRLYVLFQIGEVITNFNQIYYLQNGKRRRFDVTAIIRQLVARIQEEPAVQVVLCGHSMGGALALHCAEVIARQHRDLFAKNCSVISTGSAAALSSPTALAGFDNVSVYYTGGVVDGRFYIDPFFCRLNPKLHHYAKASVLVVEKDNVVRLREIDAAAFEAYNCAVCRCKQPPDINKIHELYTYQLLFKRMIARLARARPARGAKKPGDDAEDGDATKPDGDATKPDGDAKKSPDGDAKKSPGAKDDDETEDEELGPRYNYLTDVNRNWKREQAPYTAPLNKEESQLFDRVLKLKGNQLNYLLDKTAAMEAFQENRFLDGKYLTTRILNGIMLLYPAIRGNTALLQDPFNASKGHYKLSEESMNKNIKKQVGKNPDINTMITLVYENVHFYVMVLDVAGNRTFIYDSIQREVQFYPDIYSKHVEKPTQRVVVNCPQQENGVDCGVFALIHTILLYKGIGVNRGSEGATTAEVAQWRKRIGFSFLLRRKLEDNHVQVVQENAGKKMGVLEPALNRRHLPVNSLEQLERIVGNAEKATADSEVVIIDNPASDSEELQAIEDPEELAREREKPQRARF